MFVPLLISFGDNLGMFFLRPFNGFLLTLFGRSNVLVVRVVGFSNQIVVLLLRNRPVLVVFLVSLSDDLIPLFSGQRLQFAGTSSRRYQQPLLIAD